MTNEDLCALALAAIDDEEGWLVVKDAIEEMGWSTSYEECGHAGIAISAGSGYPRAVAAVLLFGGWPTRWELAERCRYRRFGQFYDADAGVEWTA